MTSGDASTRVRPSYPHPSSTLVVDMGETSSRGQEVRLNVLCRRKTPTCSQTGTLGSSHDSSKPQHAVDGQLPHNPVHERGHKRVSGSRRVHNLSLRPRPLAPLLSAPQPVSSPAQPVRTNASSERWTVPAGLVSFKHSTHRFDPRGWSSRSVLKKLQLYRQALIAPATAAPHFLPHRHCREISKYIALPPPPSSRSRAMQGCAAGASAYARQTSALAHMQDRVSREQHGGIPAQTKTERSQDSERVDRRGRR